MGERRKGDKVTKKQGKMKGVKDEGTKETVISVTLNCACTRKSSPNCGILYLLDIFT